MKPLFTGIPAVHVGYERKPRKGHYFVRTCEGLVLEYPDLAHRKQVIAPPPPAHAMVGRSFKATKKARR
jgi:hypothetical protein